MAISIARVPQAIRNLNRFRQIAAILWKHGFGDIISRLGVETLWIVLRPVIDFARRRAPLNGVLLFGFVLTGMLSVYHLAGVEPGIIALVIVSGVLTLLVFAGFTLYLFISGHDYRFLQRHLFRGLALVLLLGVVLGALTYYGVAGPAFQLAFSIAGFLLSTGYLLFDVSSVVQLAFEQPAIRLRTEERIRMALEELGPTFVKFGQILATRPDLLPESLIVELKKLQDDVPPFDTEMAYKIVEEELGIHMDEVFASFDPKPIAAASIAQVHKAELRTGQRVVLKIQRPGLREVIGTDLDILRVLAEFAEERIPEIRRYGPTQLVREFNRSIHKEIDFHNEAQNIKRFARNFRDDKDVYTPKVYDELSSPRVLTLEFIDGVKMTTEGIASRRGLDQRTIARNGIRILLHQVFIHGFFHADPHPGNVFIMDRNVICLIDYGMMGTLDQEQIDDILIFLTAILTKNVDRMIRLLRRREIIGESVDVRALKSEVNELIERYWGVDIKKIEVGIYLQSLFDVITRHDIKLPTELLLVGKALSTVDGIARDIYPDLDPLADIRPVILKIYFNRLKDPMFYLRDVLRTADELYYTIQRIPRKVRDIVDRVQRGELKIRLEDPDKDREIREGTRSTNRLFTAILIAAMLFASTYLLAHPRGPVFLEITLIEWLAIAGYISAGASSLGLVYGLLRTGGH